MDSHSSNDGAEHSGLLPWLSRLSGYIEDFLTIVAGLCIFALMIFGVTDIVMFLVFNNPIVGYLDIVEQSMAIFAFIAVAYAQRMGSHVRMEMFIGALRGRALWLLELIGTLIGAFVVAVIIWYSWKYFMSAWSVGDSTSNIELPTWPSKLLVPVAFTLWLVRLLIQAAGFARLVIYPDAEPIAVPTIKDAAAQARDEIRETFGDDADTGRAGA